MAEMHQAMERGFDTNEVVLHGLMRKAELLRMKTINATGLRGKGSQG
jgi:hypothetical protein